jgi:hypothetical protein
METLSERQERTSTRRKMKEDRSRHSMKRVVHQIGVHGVVILVG